MEFNVKNWDIISSEAADFLYGEFEKRLSETVTAIDVIEKRLLILVGFLFTASTTLAGLVTSQLITDPLLKKLLIIQAVVFLVIACVCGIIAVLTKQTHVIGWEPKQILDDEYLEQGIVMLKLGLAGKYQKGIENNQCISKKITHVLNGGLILTLLSPLILRIIACFFFS